MFGGLRADWRLQSMVGHYDVRLIGSLPFDWRGPRDWRCFSAQFVQWVCPGMAGCRQSLQKPASFSLLRVSTARALARSCRSSGVRRTRFGFLDVFGSAATAAGFEALRA